MNNDDIREWLTALEFKAVAERLRENQVNGWKLQVLSSWTLQLKYQATNDEARRIRLIIDAQAKVVKGKGDTDFLLLDLFLFYS